MLSALRYRGRSIQSGTVVVYADSDAQMLNSSALSVGGVFRFYGPIVQQLRITP
jgi:hypothetical protein